MNTEREEFLQRLKEFGEEDDREAFRHTGVSDRRGWPATPARLSAWRIPWPGTSFFLDAERSEYVRYWPDLTCMLSPEGLLVVDNAVDKAPELENFRRAVAATCGVRQVLVPIGNGELVIQKDPEA